MSSTDQLSYDPISIEIDKDPYPVWARLREEAPLYRNEEHDFYAVSRYDDVQKVLVDWKTYRSGRGSTLGAIKSGAKFPSGFILFEDPPEHDVHRSLLSRVFTPRRVSALEPKIRALCAETLDPHIGSGGFDFIRHLGAQMPMRTIGMLVGIPDSDQEKIRDAIDAALALDDGQPRDHGSSERDIIFGGGPFGEYHDWRRENPADDLMTDLIFTEFEDETGTRRTLTRDEVLAYIGLIASAGNETTTRLIGWTGKLLAEHPDQRQLLVEDRSLVPSAIEEILRYEAPSPVQARYVDTDAEWHGEKVPEGSIMLAINGAANRDPRAFEDPDRFDIRRTSRAHLSFGYGLHFCLGAALARLEGRIALEEVLARWPSWEIDWDNAKQAHTETVRGWERLPVFT